MLPGDHVPGAAFVDAGVASLFKFRRHSRASLLAGALPLLVTAAAAARIFTTLRVEPRYVDPFVSLVDDVSEGLKEAEGGLSEFRVRDVIGSVSFLAGLGSMDSQDMAAVFGAVPTSEYQLSGEAEASVAMTLRLRRSGPSVMLTFVKGPKNPLMSIAGWAATVDECLRTTGKEANEFAAPTICGLGALKEVAEANRTGSRRQAGNGDRAGRRGPNGRWVAFGVRLRRR